MNTFSNFSRKVAALGIRLGMPLIAMVVFTACVANAPQPTIEEGRIVERLLAIGAVLLRTERPEYWQQAEANFAYARELHPADPRPIDGLGCVAYRRGALDTAEEYFLEASELAPKYARAHSHLALIREQRGRIVAARRLHDTAVGLDPLDYQARNNRAALQLEQSISGTAASDELSRAAAVQELLKARMMAGSDGGIIESNLERFQQPSQ